MANQKPGGNRGDATRRQLLHTALRLFGRHDFDNVTTRQLATTARVNQAAIPYHFGTKGKLYQAVAQDLVDTIQYEWGDTLATLQSLIGDPETDRETLLSGLERFIQAFAHMILDGAESEFRAGFILREQLQPTSAFDILYTGLMERVHLTLTGLVARILDRDAATPEMIVRGHALLSQTLGFRMAREGLLRRLNTRTIDADAIAEQLARDITDALRREADAIPCSTLCSTTDRHDAPL